MSSGKLPLHAPMRISLQTQKNEETKVALLKNLENAARASPKRTVSTAKYTSSFCKNPSFSQCADKTPKTSTPHTAMVRGTVKSAVKTPRDPLQAPSQRGAVQHPPQSPRVSIGHALQNIQNVANRGSGGGGGGPDTENFPSCVT